MAMNTKVRNVEEYILNQPKAVQGKLHELRGLILIACPQAEEQISYGMAGYKYNGVLVYWGAFKNHFSFFGGTGKVTTQFKDELKGYVTSKGTIQFSYDKPLPKTLIKKIVKFRMKENELKQSGKKNKHIET